MKYRLPMKFKKTFLCLLAICSCIVVAWAGYKLFTHRFADPLFGSMVFLVCVVAVILVGGKVHSHPYRYQNPSLKLVLFCVLGVFVVLSFAGVQPFESYRNVVVSRVQGTIVPEAQDVRHVLFPTDEEIQADAFDLINDARVQQGLSPLIENASLGTLARRHCQYMEEIGYCCHDGSDERAVQAGSTYYGENVAEGYYSAESVVDGWLGSTGHRANIMDPGFTYSGLAYMNGYAWQVFVGG